MTMFHSLIARRCFGSQSRSRPLHKALTSWFGLDDLSLALPAVVQQEVSFNSVLAKSIFLYFIREINLILRIHMALSDESSDLNMT